MDALQALMRGAAAAKRGASQQPNGSGGKKPRQDTQQAPPAGQCPVCGRVMALSLLEAHTNSCLDLSQRVAAEPTQPTQPAPSVRPSAASRRPAAAEPTNQTPNAFTALMQGAAQSQQQHTFYLEWGGETGGRWRWHWWQNAGVGAQAAPPHLPPPEWSGMMSLKEEATPLTPPVLAPHDPTLPAGSPPAPQGSPAASPPSPERSQPPAATQLSHRKPGKPVSVHVTLHLHTNCPPGHGGSLAWHPGQHPRPPDGWWHGLPSGLKSALQKCCRLGRGEDTAAIVRHMLTWLPSEALRRLPVMCCEDSVLHPALPLVVWCMAAQAKGYELGATHAMALLQFTRELAAAPVRDYLPEGRIRPGRVLLGLQDVDRQLGAHPQEACLVKSLLLRAHFGGMSWDMSMLRDYAAYWTARFTGQAVGPPPWPPAVAAGTGTALASRMALTSQPAPPASLTAPCRPSTVSQHGPSLPPPSQAPQPGGAGEASPSGAAAPTPWLHFIQAVHTDTHVAPCSVSAVPLLARSHIPLSAIDHHVSELIPHLLAQAPVLQACHATTAGSWGREGDVNECMKSALWLFRSSVNGRTWVPHLYTCASPHSEHLELTADLERDTAERDRLQPIIAAAAPFADAFAANVIASRFKREPPPVPSQAGGVDKRGTARARSEGRA